MKISRNWLNSYIMSNKSASELVDSFTQLGLECTYKKNDSIDENIVVENLTRRKVECAEDADQILRAASRNRHTASTNSNKTSSRSHCLFALRITGNERHRDSRRRFEPC